MNQWAKPPNSMLVFRTDASLSPAAPLLSQPPTNVPGREARLVPYSHVGDTDEAPVLRLAQSWPLQSLRSAQGMETFLSLPLPLCYFAFQ